MTIITTPAGPTYSTPTTGTQTTQGQQGTQGTQGTSAAGAASGTTGTVPAEVGQLGGANTSPAGKPTLSSPKAKSALATHRLAQAEEKDVGTARQRADAKMDRAALLREMRKDRREAVCAKAFELDDFSRLVMGPFHYCLKNPVKVVVGALALGAATATAISTGSLQGFKAAMPAISAVISGIVKSSGVDEMIQRGSELALLQLGVDPKVTEKWGDAVGSLAFVGTNVAMNALGGTWDKIDFSSMGDLAADVAVLLNVPAKNAAALSAIVSMVGSGAVGIGAGIVAGDYKELSADNFKAVWTTVTQKLQGNDFKLSDITDMETFKAMQKAWGALVEDFGDLQKFTEALSALVAPADPKSNYKA